MIALLFLASTAFAQIQDEPTAVVTAAVPSAFSERIGVWTTEKLSADTFTNDRSTLNDRWNTVPGVQAREAGSPTVSIRGSSQSDRVLQLFDGAPLNMSDGAGASTLLIPTEVMSDVSLIKGPSSVFYGSSAMAGAIDHRLKFFSRPTAAGSLSQTQGAFGDRRAAVIIPIRREHSVTQFSFMSERDPGLSREHNSNDLQRATLASDIGFENNWRLSLRSVIAENQGESPGPLYFPLISTLQQTGALVSAQIAKHFESSLLSFRLTDTRVWGLYDANTAIQSTSAVSRTSLFSDLNTKLNDSILLRSFSDLSFDRLTASYSGGATYTQNDADFGQTLQIAASSEISIQPAYRYQSRYGKFFKALALVYAQGDFTQTLKYGEGFRAPSLSDRFGNFTTFVANPALQPETSWTTEFTTEFTRTLSDKFLNGQSARATVYYTGFTDLVDNRTTGGTFTKINAGSARSLGGEVNIANGDGIQSIAVSYSYLDARNFTLDEPLRLAPKHQGAITVAREIGPVTAEAKETVWSSFFDRDPTSGALRELPSWTTFDLSLRATFASWTIQTGILNAFDHPREFTIGYPEPGRRFYVNAAKSF